MSESDPISRENDFDCDDSNNSQDSSANGDTIPTFQTIEIVVSQENVTNVFVNESVSLESDGEDSGSEGETRSESEASQDVVELDSDEDSDAKEVKNESYGEDDREVQNQEENENATAQSWPTLEILPGGIIRPTENEYPYCIYVEPVKPECDALMYACGKCPMKFKVLNDLTMHLRWHSYEKKKADGSDFIARKLTLFERKLLSLKRERAYMDSEHKKKKLKILSRIANAFATMAPDYLDLKRTT